MAGGCRSSASVCLSCPHTVSAEWTMRPAPDILHPVRTAEDTMDRRPFTVQSWSTKRNGSGASCAGETTNP